MSMKVLSKLFGDPEEINGAERCPTYLYRWVVLKGRKWALYLHKFTGNDWSRDLHDHPKRFISNSVSPPPAVAILKANFPHEAWPEMRLAA